MSRMCFNCMKMTEDGDFCAYCGKKPKTAPAHHLQPGTTLNEKYVIGYALGEGGFGVTYAGLDDSLQIKVAIKEFFPKGIVGRNAAVSSNVECLNTAESGQLFAAEKAKVINEARILAKFSKERGIVNVREYFEANNTAYIVMEFLEGETLEEYLKHTGPLSSDLAFELLHPIMKVLEKLHNENVVHRDISPDNLMFDGQELKLLDFGAAREVLYSTSKSFSVILKHGYAPEEQYRRKGHQGSWTDVYSLTATLYYCITNTIPDTSLDRMHEDELKKPTDLGFVMAPHQEVALMRGLSVLPEDRLQKVGDFISAWNGEDVPLPNPEKETIAAFYNGAPNVNRTGNGRPVTAGGTLFGGQVDFVDTNSDERRVSGYYNGTPQTTETPKKNKKGLIIGIVSGAVAVLLLIAIVVAMTLGRNSGKAGKDDSITSGDTVQESLTTKHAEYLEKAEKLIAENKYDEAIATLETAEQLYGSNSEIQFKKKEVIKAKGLNELASLESAGNYKEAIKYIDRELTLLRNDADIASKRNLYVTKYREQVIKEADSTLSSKGYKEAVKLIDDALEVLPSDEALTKRKTEYEGYAPVPLTNFKAVTGDVEQEDEIEYDLLGNAYSPPNLFNVNHGWGSAGSSVMYLRESYGKLSGTIAKGRSDAFGRTTHTLTIYASKDGDWNNAETILYTWMEDTTEPVEFEVEIEGYKYLHFEVSDGGFFYLSNFELWK